MYVLLHPVISKRMAMDTADHKAVYDTYEQEYFILYKSVSKSVNSIVVGVQKSVKNGGSSEHELAMRVQKDIRRAQEILDNMRSELDQMPTEDRFLPHSRWLGYQRELDSMKHSMQQYQQGTRSHQKSISDVSASMDLEELGVSEAWSLNNAKKGSKSLLQRQEPHQYLEEQSFRIQESQQLAYETEEIGANILSTLRSQREQINNISSTVDETEGSLEKSRRLLRKMLRRLLANKLISFLIIGLLLVAIALLIYFKVYLSS